MDAQKGIQDYFLGTLFIRTVLCITHKTYYALYLCMFCIRWLELLTRHKRKPCVIYTQTQSLHATFLRDLSYLQVPPQHINLFRRHARVCTCPNNSQRGDIKKNAHLKKTYINHRWNSLMWRTSKSSLNQSLKTLGEPIRFFYRIPWLNPSRCVHWYTACEHHWTV